MREIVEARGDKRVSSLQKNPASNPPVRKFDGPPGVSATNYACADTRCLLTENANEPGPLPDRVQDSL